MPPSRYSPEDEEDEELAELHPPPAIEAGFSKTVIVDNIPVIPAEKYDKLRTVIEKIFKSVGPVVTFHMPQDENKVTRGFCFVEFEKAESAELAIEKTNGYKLDKQHIFKVTPYNDLDKYSRVPDEYEAPEIKPYEPTENLRAWLLNERGCDEYAIKYADTVEIVWNDKPTETPETDVKREKWTESYIQWSPLGTYLVTLHPRGVAIWGGPNWSKIQRFAQLGPTLVDWSPNEKYLVTASPRFQENDNPKDPQCIIVWDVRTGQKLRGFQSLGSKEWPVFKWSHDDRYLARLHGDNILIYQTPTMDLLDKAPLVVPNIKSFAWSPSESSLAYFVPEANEKPASVVLVDLPSRRERRQKNLFSVSDCRIHWHPSGDYLLVKVDRWTKNKKSTYTSFEVFRMKEKQIPIENLELKENILFFQWEPKGHRFAIIHGESGRVDVSFYTMEKQLRLLRTLEKKSVNALFWSPQGNHIVLAGLGNLNGQLEFFDVNAMESMGTDEHFTTTALDWDPTGRYVSSTVSYWKHQVETGYKLFSFQGKLLKSVLKDKFFALQWRPRPQTLLPKERVEYIQKNIKALSQDHKRKDRQRRIEEKEQKRAFRTSKRQEFQSFLDAKLRRWEQQAEERRKLIEEEEEEREEDYRYVETWVEQIVEEREEILQD
eukprot:TRINITY_DN30996_c0_g1_i1.p1 TRINITY_DN30996_c0_g1~~TRINITY_DN30996_c0_g1_i1.p1  ORF type:complete len:681 (-),score=213.67 TRINITY_DN30996_c0_g1_i1:785-2761(-)